ncbi:hypothetical protein BCR33DRAFT_782783 [Rhizoclosmatium globosum]|uniref:Carotenoid oxygenase n=1 Tax=Rhizoclosmatium globosum TaxID=329046 RepID=A0A1Y2CL49_9FUNG|nr:hypothetical protein BCR33DRAFT_782783 [Rhizoclosmatium globosum]|eukprot:ORY47687.1 hypothetical protein BCR33DRAFT_782783 [Rhizoclosmatium globosum]
MSKTLTDAMEWDSKRSPRIVVIDRREKRVVAEYEHITPEFCFHTVNAFEDGNGDILMDAIVYKTGEVIPAFLVNTLRESREFKAPEVARARELIDTTVKRIRLPNLQLEKSRYVPNDVGMPVNSPKTMVEFHAPVSMELPRINPKFRHREDYRYVYGVSAMFRHLHSHTLYDSLVKFDAKTQSHKSWMKVGHTPSEPMFVPNPNGNGEDDGVVLSIVLDGSLKKSYMLVLDAKSFEEIAKADIGQALPYGLHGAFV